jgi:hypothetical protein
MNWLQVDDALKPEPLHPLISKPEMPKKTSSVASLTRVLVISPLPPALQVAR